MHPAEEIGGRANILVAEVFDTELIGEEALETFKHALEELLEEDSIVIPQSAVIVAQPVQSVQDDPKCRPAGKNAE